ncbi:MAG: PilZ domain-containing protein [Nitrospira sp.]|nr:PilZ domain-containing protein [Nitrospira sp.]
MGVKRELFRVSMAREGVVRCGTEVAPCAITDLTSHGIGVSTDLQAVRGDTLELMFHLTDKHPICCTILVTYATPPHLGGRITAISSEHRNQLARYIEQHAFIALTAF